MKVKSVTVILFSLVFSGCPKTYKDTSETLRSGAEKYCSQLLQCKCTDPDVIFADVDTCVKTLEKSYTDLVETQASQDAQIAMDEACIGNFLAFMAEVEACYTQENLPETKSSEDSNEEPNPCKAFYGPKKLGEACQEVESIDHDDCGPGLYCNDKNLCRNLSDLELEEGESCAGDEGYCLSGLYCDNATEKCAKLKAAGAICADTQECADSLNCIDAQCSSGNEVGESCVSIDDCKKGLRCNAENLCAALIKEGEDCVSTTDCTENLYCSPNTNQCEKGAAKGADCEATSYVCQADLECNYADEQAEKNHTLTCLPIQALLCELLV